MKSRGETENRIFHARGAAVFRYHHARRKRITLERACFAARFAQHQGMALFVPVAFHPSQFPERIRAELLESLRRRKVSHKFLYDGVKQTQKWLELHQACSPSKTDPDCAAIYDQAFNAAAAGCGSSRDVHLVGLGCGGGQKDTRCLEVLRRAGKRVSYTPVDVSSAMVLTACQAAVSATRDLACTPLVCDLSTALDLPAVLDELTGAGRRVITFFGMMPNFEPEVILPRLTALIRREDVLLLSANLAPGADYEAGMHRILPMYDNRPTRDWLGSFLADLGVSEKDGRLEFRVEQQKELKRIVAKFVFAQRRDIAVDAERFAFSSGERLQVFFSYRYTPALLQRIAREHQIELQEHWIAPSAEEAVFLARRV